jgi:hypothetical protein
VAALPTLKLPQLMLALSLLCPIAMVAPVLEIVAAPLLTTPLVGRAVAGRGAGVG